MVNNDFIPLADPWALFEEWFTLAKQQEPKDPDAVAVATVGGDGMPSVRILLLKGYGDDGCVIQTNRQSRKGKQLEQNPKAALCLYWKSIGRQVRIEGPVALLSDAESDAYFATRPRESRIGAWASQQSNVLSGRAELEQSIKDLEKRFEGQDVPRPPYWGGYRVMPLMVEFWQERPYRLHDRLVYRRQSPRDKWKWERLYP